MRITINCRSILKEQRTGIGRYTYHLIKSLGEIDTHNQYQLYTPKRIFDFKRQLPSFDFKNFKNELDLFNQGARPSDIYHLPSPDYLGQNKGKVVVTVHDLIHRAYPQGHTPETIDLTEKYIQEIVTKADRIICSSESTRNDLHRYYDFPEEKSTTILNGVDHDIFYKINDLAKIRERLSSLGIEDNFILYVGTIEPRKNLQGVLEALAILKVRNKALPKLVVVGMRGWMMDQVQVQIKKLGLEDHVIFTGFLTDCDLNLLYNSCQAFVFPSFYEGFGFPIVEAFCAGACVITSSTSSCGEIASDAALLVDPANIHHMADTIEKVLEDSVLRAEFKTRALGRAQEFSFKITAVRTLRIYEDLYASI